MWTAIGERLGWSAVARSGRVGATLAITSFVDAAGTGAFMASVAVFLVGVAGLRVGQVGLGFSIAGVVGFVATVPMALLAEQIGARAFLVATSTIRAGAFALYLLIHSFTAFTLVASLVAASAAAWFPVQQAFVGVLFGGEERVAVMASVRALRNLGYALGGGVAVAALAVGGRGGFVAVTLTNAVSFALAAFLYSTLPTTEVSVRPSGGRLKALRDARYLGLMLSSTVFATSLVLLDIGIPLWIAERTTAPRALVGVVVTLNTVLVVLLQVRVARGAETVGGSVAMLFRSALGFVLCCGLFALSSQVGAAVAGTLVVLGAIALTFGEMFESPAWWTISFELAPADRRTEYLGAFALNYELVAIAGPALAAMLVQSGDVGWGVLAVAFALAAAAARMLVGADARRRLPEPARS